MHNAPMLTRGRRRARPGVRIHPDDAAALGIADGESVVIRSKTGAVEVPATVSDEMTRGNVAYPHGWGHGGGWAIANEAGGVNINRLSSAAPEDLERLAAMAVLNGVAVSIEPVVTPRSAS
jgi:formate dehydrogenase